MLVILIVFIVIILIVIALIFALKKYARWLKKLKHKISQRTCEQRQIAIEAVLKRVASISQDNKEFHSIYKKLIAIYKQFINYCGKLQVLTMKLQKRFELSSFLIGESRNLYLKFQSLDRKIRELENSFNNLAHRIVTQDEILRREFYFYQKKLRLISNAYTEKQVLFETMDSKVKNFNQSIFDLEKQFELIIDQGDNLQAEIIIQRYIHKVVTFAKIVDCGPALAAQLQTQIPNAIANLKKLYFKVSHQNVDTNNFSPLAFNFNITQITKPFQKAQKAFESLDIPLAIKKIKIVLEQIANFENKIKTEIKAELLFNEQKKRVTKEVEKIIRKWHLLNRQFEEIASFGTTVSSSLFDIYNDAKASFQELARKLNDFQKLVPSKISYIAKIEQVIFLLASSKRAMALGNNFANSMKRLNVKKANAQAKFLHAETIFNNIVSTAKHRQIVLTPSDHGKIRNIRIEKASLVEKLSGITNFDVPNIDKFLENVAGIYKIISTKIQMAFHIKNLIHEFAPKRALNPRLHIGLQVAENKYLEGDYAASLNETINCLRLNNLYV